MTSRISHTTFDAHDTRAQAAWWAEVLGYTVEPDLDPDEPDVEILPRDDTPPGAGVLLFQVVPEGKTVKNRLHLDLRPTDRSRDEEVERVLGLGATQLADLRNPDGTGWVVLADPEGNEFCILRSDAEVAATTG
ncbi:putative enzyme related to lactoylglutathione lyase [Mumia flava]|uniref:Putative enzyme related to lactoylglutathione lyase n=1 Tax=Mumia flava TaxID=1348852 RepID=A0A0B2BRU1_9ACTN|nr:VOC family protein [Mumia flava]PJJ57603.1 putative enzyme related to lactoylglutathione lyase [Mumia flava]